jgi:hypothetical protein
MLIIWPPTTETVTAAAEPAAAAERHGGRCHDDKCRHRGRGKAPEQFGPHDSDPPYALREFSSAPANGNAGVSNLPLGQGAQLREDRTRMGVAGGN